MFLIGWFARRQIPQDSQHQLERTEVRGRKSKAMPSGRVVSDLSQWNEVIQRTDRDELSSVASRLLASSHGQSVGHWAPLLARWSVSDGAGMISFIEKQAPPSIRETLLQNAWFAWGYADPDEAFISASNLSNSLTLHLLTGIAESSPLKAAAYVKLVPDSQFAVGPITASIFEADPDLADELAANAVYDGGRGPFEQLRIKHLAKSDPAAAIAYARSLGVLGRDQVPIAVKKIALIDPAQAAAQVNDMPSNRSKALSAVALASTWAATDVDAATKWARENLSGPSAASLTRCCGSSIP